MTSWGSTPASTRSRPSCSRPSSAHLPSWNAHRRRAAQLYWELLRGLDVVGLPSVASGNEHVWHLFVVRIPERDRVAKQLQTAGIGVGVHYPIPLHLQPAFAHLGHLPGEFPVGEKAALEILSLPIYPGISLEQQQTVVALVASLHYPLPFIDHEHLACRDRSICV